MLLPELLLLLFKCLRPGVFLVNVLPLARWYRTWFQNFPNAYGVPRLSSAVLCIYSASSFVSIPHTHVFWSSHPLLSSFLVILTSKKEQECVFQASRWPESCQITGAVYQITCVCGDRYIRESGQSLHISQQHQTQIGSCKARSYINKPMTRDWQEKHQNAGIPTIIVAILGAAHDQVERCILKAKFVKQLCPEVSSRTDVGSNRSYHMSTWISHSRHSPCLL